MKDELTKLGIGLLFVSGGAFIAGHPSSPFAWVCAVGMLIAAFVLLDCVMVRR